MSATFPKTADIVIIGGGVMGSSCAYHLAKAGVRDVVLLEKDVYFGQGATGRCAGGVRYQFATEINIRLSIASLAMLEDFRDETGVDPAYRQCGYLFVLTRPEDVKAFERNVDLQRRLGVQTEWLSGDDVRSRLPHMRFEDALAGTFHAKDGLADPNSIVMGYVQAARRMGARCLTEAEVVGLEVQNGRIVAVETRLGRAQTHTVINAAGPWAGLIGAMAGVEIPIAPVRRQMLTTTPLPDLPKDFPFVIDFAQSLYFHREGDGILTGMSNPSQEPGFDQGIDEEWELVAMEAALERLPMLEKAGRLAGWAGLYEITPDSHPIFGPTPVEGFFVVGGFSGHGFMHGPVAGQIMTEYLLEGSPRTVDVTPLNPARFDEGRLIQEYNVV